VSDSQEQKPPPSTSPVSNPGRAPSSPLGPQIVEAEEIVLGAVLIDADVLPNLLGTLEAKDFFELKHQWIWESAVRLQERGDVVDPMTIAADLRSQNRLESVGGQAYLTYLISVTPTYLYTEAYAAMVERASVRRRLLTAAGKIAELARDEATDIQDVLGKAEAELFRVTEKRGRQDMIPMSDAVQEYYDRIEYLYTNPQEQLGLTCGFRDIDSLLGGLQRSDLIIVAARPGVGKTSFMLGVALNAARKAAAKVAIFSLEMGKEQLIQRFYAVETGINSQRLRLGNLEEDEWTLFAEATGKLNSLNIFIDDTPGISVQQLRAKCRRLHRERKLDLIIIDYLQLMSAGGVVGRQENRVQEVSAISRGLKELAREINVPVITASQLSRSVEQRADKRPQLSDLRESGSIEQDADIVMFLYRDELYNENTDRPNQADVIVAKHRNGPTDTITLYFRRELTQFLDMSKSRQDLGY
jgi:replicative DNA helicase